MKEIEPNELARFMRGRPGLIIGPSASLNLSDATELANRLQKEFGMPAQGGIIATCDDIAKSGVDEVLIRNSLREAVGNTASHPGLDILCKANWSAVLSLSLDRYFEIALQSAAFASPARDDATTIQTLESILRPHTVPVFKLLGLADRGDFPLTLAQYKRLKSKWRFALANFVDRVKGNPVVVMGIRGVELEFEDLLAETLSSHSTAIRQLVFFASDDIANRSDLQELAGTSTELRLARTSLGNLIEAIAQDPRSSDSQLALDFSSDEEKLTEAINSGREVVAHVPSRLKSVCQPNDKNLIVDRLFSPDSLAWDAFAHGYDFERDVQPDVIQTIQQSKNGSWSTVVLGNAGSGKTSLLKRVSTELSNSSSLVFWAKPYFGDSVHLELDRFFSKIAKLEEVGLSQIVIFVDDPYAYGSISANEFARSASKNRVHLHLVLGIRNTDWEIDSANAASGGLKLANQHQISDVLTSDEWSRLPAFLVKIGVFPKTAEAEDSLRQAESRSARDTFATLFFLLPEVRATLKSSIQEQYFRLGDQAALKKFVIGGLETTLDVLRDAWAMTAVADNYRAPLPIEILVNTLGIDYGAWVDATKSLGPAYGLLYEQVSDEGDTVLFRTRNSAVTDILVEAVNGGAFGYSGELAWLKRMFACADGHSSSVYRDFIARILIPNDNLKRLSPKDGLDLYDLAVKSLVARDKAIEHHRGLWFKNTMDDPQSAEECLRQALDAPNFPYRERQESNRNIHTTLAANELRKIDKGLVSFELGRSNMTNELSKARSIQDCDPRIAQLQSKLVSRLIRTNSGLLDHDTIFLFNRALSDIDRAIIAQRSVGKTTRRSIQTSKSLEEARDELQELVSNINDVKTEAETLWQEYQSQAGFVLVARLMHRKAVNSNRGKDFNAADNYCNGCIGRIHDSGVNVDATLYEVTLHNLCRWQLPVLGSSGTPPTWERLIDLSSEVLADNELSADPFTRFVHSVAKAHLSGWSDAHAGFRSLRTASIPSDTMHSPRTLFVDGNGNPRKVEGIVHTSGDRTFLSVAELGTDIECNRRDHWRRDGLENHAFIEFAFYGPRAITDRTLSVRWGFQ